MARLIFRQPLGVDPAKLWDLFSSRSITSLWIFPNKPSIKFSESISNNPLGVCEVLRIGPIIFKVIGAWAELVPLERSLLLLDGPRGIRIAEEIRLEKIASGTDLSLTMDFSLGFGIFGDWLDRMWISRWVSKRIRWELLKLQQKYPLNEEEPNLNIGDVISFERPEEIPQKDSF